VIKRTWLLVGVAVGIVLGASMGRGPYEKLERAVRRLGSRPETRRVKNSLFNAASDISDTTADTITQASEKVQEKISSAAL
jgi:hypothetical protein